MRPAHQCPKLLLRETSRDKQHCRCSAEQGLVELHFVNDKVLVEDGDGYAALPRHSDEVVVTAEILAVGEDAQGGGAVLLIAQGNQVCPTLFLDPPFRRRATFELGEDACVALEQGLAQRGLRAAHVSQLLALGGNYLL